MRELCRVFYLVCAFVPCISWADNFPATGVVPFPSIPVKTSVSFISIPTGSGLVAPVAFPKSVADLSMDDKVALRTAGYEPYRDMKPYTEFIVEGEEQFLERQMALAEHEREEDLETMSPEEYCENNPWDEEVCPQIPGMVEELVAIGDAPLDYAPDQTSYTGPTIGGGVVVENNQVRGGSCYLASKFKPVRIHGKMVSVPNDVFTSCRYEKVSPAFEKAMLTLFRKEGRCGEIKNDPCGFTCYGIGENCLGKTLGLTKDKLKGLTRPQAEDIYYKHYWQKYHLDKLPDVISGTVFLAMMGSGATGGGQLFRDFLGLPKKNGQIDNDVIRAVMNYKGDILNDWLNRRQKFLADVAENRYNNTVLAGYMKGVKLKRENGCHVRPIDPMPNPNCK